MTTGVAPQSLQTSSLVIAPASEGGILQDTLLEHFSQLSDPRTALRLICCSTSLQLRCWQCSEADGWEAIETFGQSRQAWLAQFLSLNGILIDRDTFRRLFARLDPIQFQQCFRNWVNALTQALERR